MKPISSQNKSVVITALVCITALELFALYKGVNGVLLTFVIGVVCAIIGVAIPTPKFLK